MKSPIFIVGIPRSGSTLWQNIIVRDPNILRLAEVLFLSPWRKDFRYFLRTQVGELSTDENINKMIDLIFADRAVPGITSSFWRLQNLPALENPNLKDDIFEKIKRSNKSLESLFKILIEEITHLSGYSRACVAFPVYPNYIPKLQEWYPDSKIVHVSRDPRAIAMSKTKDPGGTAHLLRKHPHLKYYIRKKMILFVVVQYIWTSRLHSKLNNRKNYKYFQYEDLLVEPEKTIKKLCDFVKIPFSPELLEPKENFSSRSSITGKQYKGFNKKAASHWKNNISPLELKFINFLTKGSMRRFDFDPGLHSIYNG